MPERNVVWSRWKDLSCADYDGAFSDCVTYWRNRPRDHDERLALLVTLSSSTYDLKQAFEYDHPCKSGKPIRAEHRLCNPHAARDSWYCGTLNDRALLAAFLRYPLIILKVMAAIRGEGF